MTIYYPTIPRLKERLYIASSGHSILIYCQSSTIPDRPGIASSNTFCHCPDVKRSNCAPKIITMTTCATDTFNDSSSLSAACQVSMFKFHLWVVEARHTAFQVGPGLKKVPAPIQFFFVIVLVSYFQRGWFLKHLVGSFWENFVLVFSNWLRIE